MKMYAASRKPLYRSPFVLMTPTREVVQAGVVAAAVVVLVLVVVRKLAIDLRLAPSQTWSTQYRTWTMN